MSGPIPGRAISADGTVICFDQYGTGPAVVFVHGALTDRGFPTLVTVAERLAPWFSVFNYDRRGRGESGDTTPYDVEREIDDLRAVIGAAGGNVMIFGGSSGGGLALRPAAAIPAVSKIVVWEPPYHVDQSAPAMSEDFADRLAALVSTGRRGDAVETFMLEAAGMRAADVMAMRAGPAWAQAEAIAHTLAYEAAVMGPGNTMRAASLAGLALPALVLTGELSPAWLIGAGRSVAAAIPAAIHRVLAGQTHAVCADALAPELLAFFTA